MEYIETEVRKIVAATAKAFLCRLDDGEEYWIPRSRVEDANDFEAGETDCVMYISDWFLDRMEPAEKKSVFDQRARGGNYNEPG